MDALQAAAETAAPSGTTLKRRLQGRHIAMIAIGGSIGTGLFVASGASVAQAGPGGAIAAYIAIGMMVYFVVTGLGEMAALMPVSGSFAIYGEKYVDEGFGVALGWTYWYSWAVTIAIELVAAQIVMRYWFPTIPGIWWGAGFLVLIFLLNTLSVRGFGESEYWFSLIKVVFVICRDTEEEAHRVLAEIQGKADVEAVEGFRQQVQNAGASSKEGKGMWSDSKFEDLVQYNDGFKTKLIGTKEQIADRILLLKSLGADILLTAFLHYDEEIEQFGREVLPLVRALEKQGRGKDEQYEIGLMGDVYRARK